MSERLSGLHVTDIAGLEAPALVLAVGLDELQNFPDRRIDVARFRSVWALVTAGGVPRSVGYVDVSADLSVRLGDLAALLRAAATETIPTAAAPAAAPGVGTDLTVVICTRRRPAGLAALLRSLRAQTDRDFGVLVVDNTTGDPETAQVVADEGPAGSRYLAEPRPGLSHARNAGAAATTTSLTAWLDDDEIADGNWVAAMKTAFARAEAPDAVAGLMFPAQLETRAQVLFEQYGGHNKGRRFEPLLLRADTVECPSSLFPLPSFGTGGNMAVRTEWIRAVGGFDTRLGAGTRTMGAEDTKFLSALLRRGGTILQWPDAYTWHTHRTTMDELQLQMFGYGSGLTAFLASWLREDLRTLPEFIRLAPRALREITGRDGVRAGHLADDFPRELVAASRRGLASGPFRYASEMISGRRFAKRRDRVGHVD